jgi:DNA-binding XRE family transcriptional regulator
VDLCQKLTKYVGACLLVDLFIFVVFWFLLLRVEVHVNIVKLTFCVNFLESAVVLPLLNVAYEIAQSVNAIGSDVFCITVTVVDFFLSQRYGTCLGRPRRLAYYERGLMTCPGAYVKGEILGHCV